MALVGANPRENGFCCRHKERLLVPGEFFVGDENVFFCEILPGVFLLVSRLKFLASSKKKGMSVVNFFFVFANEE